MLDWGFHRFSFFVPEFEILSRCLHAAGICQIVAAQRDFVSTL
jgi:hypothetical protein